MFANTKLVLLVLDFAQLYQFPSDYGILDLLSVTTLDDYIFLYLKNPQM
jgi:hypothetical protein